MTEIERILSKYVSHGAENDKLLAAAFIAVGKGGNILQSSSAGSLRFDGDEPFTEDSVSWIASMTKLVTSVAVLQVVEKGLVGLDDDLGKLVPELANLEVLKGFDTDGKPILTKQGKAVTLRQLLSHSSGFGYDSFDPDLVKWNQSIGRTDNYNTLYSFDSLKIPLKFEPGDGWVYGIGLDWAGHVVEVLANLSLEEYMRKNILQPLEMNSTTFRISEHPELESRRAAIGFRAVPGSPLVPGQSLKPDSTPLDCGGVGLYSTAADYAKLLGALLDGGRDILRSDTVRELFKPQLADPSHLEQAFYGDGHTVFCPEYPTGTKVNYGLGGALNLEDLAGRRRAGSMMWSGVTNPRWWLDPKTGVAGTLFVQVLPPGDSVVSKLYSELEEAVYRQARQV